MQPEEWPITLELVEHEFATQRNALKNGTRTRALASCRVDGKCLAWRIIAKMAPLTISFRVCHAGNRNNEAYDRGRPVNEFNGGEDLVHSFSHPGERLEVDLEALATKSEPLLKNYTNPGGLSLALLVRFELHGQVHEVYGGNVALIGSTKRKRAMKKVARRDNEEDEDPNLSPQPSLDMHTPCRESWCNSPDTAPALLGCSTRLPLGGLAPNTRYVAYLRAHPFFAIKSSPQLNSDMVMEQDFESPLGGLEPDEIDSDLVIFSDMEVSRESSTCYLPDEHPSGPLVPSCVEPKQFQDPIAEAMGLPDPDQQMFDESSYLSSAVFL